MTNQAGNHTSLVTIITPVFNGADTIRASITSALNQTYQNIELIIINDGSTDKTLKVVEEISATDARVQVLSQKNKGVSAARNAGLAKMQGDFFCFLDADDEFPINSIESRLNIFNSDETLDFVDGFTDFIDPFDGIILRTFKPSLKGNPWKDLALLMGKTFCAPTWLIKNNKNQNYTFDETLTHGEDLTFYLDISKNGNYSFCESTVLKYSQTSDSAMSNIEGLGEFYFYHLKKIKHQFLPESVTEDEYSALKKNVKKIMIKSAVKKKKLFLAVKWGKMNLSKI